MAGHKAASAAPSWPTINGSWIPNGLFSKRVNLVENKITVQFIHRGLAYLLLIATIGWTIVASRMATVGGLFKRVKSIPLLFVLLQVLLGIITVLVSPGIVPNHWVLFDWMAQLHQVVGMLYLLAMVAMLYFVRRQPIT